MDIAPRFGGVLFDKDGTLFDFSRTWDAWAKAVLQKLAKDETHLARLAEAIAFDLSAGRFRADSLVIAGTPFEIAQSLNPELPGMHLSDIIEFLNKEASRAPQAPAADLVPLFQVLSGLGLRLGVATNDAEAPARAHLESAGVIDRFEFIAGFDSGWGGKPDPGQLLAFADALQLAPEACIMVGDSRHDLAAGTAAGFTRVGVLTGVATAEDLHDLADVILPDISYLPDWIIKEAAT